MKWIVMYRDFFAALSLKKPLFTVLIIKLFLIWTLFHYLYHNPYKDSPSTAPSAIAQTLKP
ncbi:MAG: hypothetical protein IE884_06120 [Sulfuricurvum sp.]|nr:hypothetical protein [Sulfuricurvum sp.]